MFAQPTFRGRCPFVRAAHLCSVRSHRSQRRRQSHADGGPHAVPAPPGRGIPKSFKKKLNEACFQRLMAGREPPRQGTKTLAPRCDGSARGARAFSWRRLQAARRRRPSLPAVRPSPFLGATFTSEEPKGLQLLLGFLS